WLTTRIESAGPRPATSSSKPAHHSISIEPCCLTVMCHAMQFTSIRSSGNQLWFVCKGVSHEEEDWLLSCRIDCVVRLPRQFPSRAVDRDDHRHCDGLVGRRDLRRLADGEGRDDKLI